MKEKKVHSVPPVQYIERIVRVGGCLVVAAQWSEHWQLKPGSIPGDCRLFTFFSFTSKASLESSLIASWRIYSPFLVQS